MSFRNVMQAVALAAFLGTPLSASAQKVKAPAGGKKISKELIGIFFGTVTLFIILSGWVFNITL